MWMASARLVDDLQRLLRIALDLHLLRRLAVETIPDLAQRRNITCLAEFNKFFCEIAQTLCIVLRDNALDRL